jgi:hypothetical protein
MVAPGVPWVDVEEDAVVSADKGCIHNKVSISTKSHFFIYNSL